MEIILVRHGETDWNLEGRLMGQKDVPLNDKGREQAELLKIKLANIEFDCCYSSPLSRAKETARIICKNRCNIIYDDNLKERSGGELEGTIISHWNDYNNNSTVEADEEILNRAKHFLEMLKNTSYQKVLIVSHNGLLKNLRHCILEKPGKLNYDDNNLPNGDYEIYEIYKI